MSHDTIKIFDCIFAVHSLILLVPFRSAELSTPPLSRHRSTPSASLNLNAHATVRSPNQHFTQKPPDAQLTLLLRTIRYFVTLTSKDTLVTRNKEL